MSEIPDPNDAPSKKDDDYDDSKPGPLDQDDEEEDELEDFEDEEDEDDEDDED